METSVLHADDSTPVTASAPPISGLSKSRIAAVSDFLQDNCRIGSEQTHYDKYRRFITLETTSIFNSLVLLYTQMFLSTWHYFKRFMEQFTPPGQTTAWTYAARVYISHWFIDLYVANREAVRKLSPLAFSQHYLTEMVSHSLEYDQFLVLLNATIRPTVINGTPESSLYIPLLSLHINQGDNPFNVNNFTLNYDLFMGILGIMKSKKEWNMSTLPTSYLGRPSWLFDWHEGGKCCAWFPAEGNYNMDDVSLAYIIGEACSPKLGIRDVDDWQDFATGYIPAHINITDYQRAVDRRFFGSYEVRTIATDYHEVNSQPPTVQVAAPATSSKTPKKGQSSRIAAAHKAKKAKYTEVSATSGAQTEPAEPSDTAESEDTGTYIVPRFQISDWCYYRRVILNIEYHTRTGALRQLILN